MDRREAVERLEEIKEEIWELADEALRVTREVGDESDHQYAKGYWYAHIVTALDDESGYVGGSMGPLQSTIDRLREGPEADTVEAICTECDEPYGETDAELLSVDQLEAVYDDGRGPRLRAGRCRSCRLEEVGA